MLKGTILHKDCIFFQYLGTFSLKTKYLNISFTSIYICEASWWMKSIHSIFVGQQPQPGSVCVRMCVSEAISIHLSVTLNVSWALMVPWSCVVHLSSSADQWTATAVSIFLDREREREREKERERELQRWDRCMAEGGYDGTDGERQEERLEEKGEA